MNHLIVKAFNEIRNQFSVDRVIADPDLNARFVDVARSYGLKETPAKLNLSLLNSRKRGGLNRSTRRTVIRNQDAFAFASEIAIRTLERKHQTTLDRVLCDPELAQEFDCVAAAIAPGYSPLEYRWAALRLRKSNQLKPEMIGRAVPTKVFAPMAAAELDLTEVPNQQGIYLLANREKVLYIGEAKNLRMRLKKHLDHSDNKFLARYLWEFGKADLLIEYHVLPPNTRTDVRKAMELELIRSRRAEFNVQR